MRSHQSSLESVMWAPVFKMNVLCANISCYPRLRHEKGCETLIYYLMLINSLLTWIITVAAFSTSRYGASVIYTHGIPQRLWGKYCLKVLTFLQWGDSIVLPRQSHNISRPFSGRTMRVWTQGLSGGHRLLADSFRKRDGIAFFK